MDNMRGTAPCLALLIPADAIRRRWGQGLRKQAGGGVLGKQNMCRKSRGRRHESYTSIAAVKPATSGLHLKAPPGWSRT
jgi:hypothetical protein